MKKWKDENYRMWKSEIVVGEMKGRGKDVEVEKMVE